MVKNARNGKLLQANNRNKIRHLKLLGNMCIKIVCLAGCDIMKFEINLTLFNQAFSTHDQKVKAKT